VSVGRYSRPHHLYSAQLSRGWLLRLYGRTFSWPRLCGRACCRLAGWPSGGRAASCGRLTARLARLTADIQLACPLWLAGTVAFRGYSAIVAAAAGVVAN